MSSTSVTQRPRAADALASFLVICGSADNKHFKGYRLIDAFMLGSYKQTNKQIMLAVVVILAEPDVVIRVGNRDNKQFIFCISGGTKADKKKFLNLTSIQT